MDWINTPAYKVFYFLFNSIKIRDNQLIPEISYLSFTGSFCSVTFFGINSHLCAIDYRLFVMDISIIGNATYTP